MVAIGSDQTEVRLCLAICTPAKWPTFVIISGIIYHLLDSSPAFQINFIEFLTYQVLFLPNAFYTNSNTSVVNMLLIFRRRHKAECHRNHLQVWVSNHTGSKRLSENPASVLELSILHERRFTSRASPCSFTRDTRFRVMDNNMFETCHLTCSNLMIDTFDK